MLLLDREGQPDWEVVLPPWGSTHRQSTGIHTGQTTQSEETEKESARPTRAERGKQQLLLQEVHAWRDLLRRPTRRAGAGLYWGLPRWEGVHALPVGGEEKRGYPCEDNQFRATWATRREESGCQAVRDRNLEARLSSMRVQRHACRYTFPKDAQTWLLGADAALPDVGRQPDTIPWTIPVHTSVHLPQEERRRPHANRRDRDSRSTWGVTWLRALPAAIIEGRQARPKLLRDYEGQFRRAPTALCRCGWLGQSSELGL